MVDPAELRRGVRAVFFDVGGTLVHPHPSFAALLARTCREQGLAVTAADAEAAELRVWARIGRRADAGRGFSLSPDRSRAFWLWVYRVFLDELGYGRRNGTDLPQRLFGTFTRPESYRVYEDVVPTLARLRAAGLMLGVISNWERWLDRLMLHLDIQSYFDVTVVSGLVGIEKPDAGIFVRALEDAGVVAEAAVHVGDNPQDDVAGARAVGMRGVLLDRLDRFAPVLPRSAGTWGLGVGGWSGEAPRIHTLHELPELLGLPPST